MVEFVWTQGRGEGFGAARSVREQVFVAEQGYSAEGEFDEQDGRCLHVTGFEAGAPVCTARLYTDEDGAWHVGRVAVLPVCRGKGAGLALMQEVLDKVRLLGGGRVVLSAQADKTAFYARVGFAPTGATCLDEGQPHVWMQREI